MIKVILWDVDGTLLDFGASEACAIRACFEQFGLGQCPDGMLERYSQINQRYWRALERGELSKPQVLRGRFEEFFAQEGIQFDDVDAFNHEYQVRLGDTVVFRDGSDALVRDLRGRVRQYAVTNGTLTAQRRKLEKSGLDRLLDGAFISDQLGVEKPDRRFFDLVFAAIGTCAPGEAMIVGDSLTSDMQGGRNAGILCCWYDPCNRPAPSGLTLDYHIQNLNQLRDLLSMG